MLMRVNIRCRICLQQATVVSYYFLHRRCHLVVYSRSCSVPPTVPVHFCELGGAGTLFASNQRHRIAVPLHPKLPSQPLGCYQFHCLVNRCTMGVNSLLKTVTRQCRSCDLNPGPTADHSATEPRFRGSSDSLCLGCQ